MRDRELTQLREQNRWHEEQKAREQDIQRTVDERLRQHYAQQRSQEATPPQGGGSEGNTHNALDKQIFSAQEVVRQEFKRQAQQAELQQALAELQELKSTATSKSSEHATVNNSMTDAHNDCADGCGDVPDVITQPSLTDQPLCMPPSVLNVCRMMSLPPPPAQWPNTPPPWSQGEAAQFLKQFEQQHHSQLKPRPQRAAPAPHASSASPTESAASPDALPPPALALTDQQAPATCWHAPESTSSLSKSLLAAVPPEYWDTAPTEQGMRQASTHAQAYRDSIISTGRA